MSRYLTSHVTQDLTRKMVFMGGPRQVGKTTLSLDVLGGDESHPAYLNWDFPGAASQLQQAILPGNEPLIILDEIHKYPGWRNLVKGLYDRYKSQRQFLVTGSAQLDFYRHGGDSLQGRYHHYRLHPFSLAEVNPHANAEDVAHLLEFGGFPEPFTASSERHWRRWQKERKTRVINEDLATLERVHEIAKIHLLVDCLPGRVGSPLSLRSLMEDLSVAHKTVGRWLTILESLYMIFRLLPLGLPKIRAVRKEQKLYFWDWSLCMDKGARFENLVAAHLLKYCHYIEDTEGHSMELRYLRDTDKREIDFVVIQDNEPLFAVECKAQDRDLSPHIKYFSRRTKIPYFYQVSMGKADYEVIDCRARVLPFSVFSRLIPLV